MYNIRKAAVIGSGVMGAGIAAHLANAGIEVSLLDIIPNKLTEEEEKKGLTLNDVIVRNRIVLNAKEKLTNKKSMALYVPSNIDFITFGNMEDNLQLLKEADWIIEAVPERMDIKNSVYNKIIPYIKEDAILSSNTSGISVNTLCEAFPNKMKERFIITHFFNPPRFMKLLEIIPCKKTKEEVVIYMGNFCEERLGKGVVIAKDTPGFVGNRIGTYASCIVFNKMKEYNLSIEEVDAITGKELGRPKTGSFRLADMVGIDTFLNVSAYLSSNTKEKNEKYALTVPEFVAKMAQKGYLGDKTRGGFYKKTGKEILVINPETLEYKPKKEVRIESLALAKKARSLKDKLNIMVYSKDSASRFAWDLIKNTLLFSARRYPEISEDLKAIDNGMKWGYNWEVGPFELWDLIGVRKSVEIMKSEGETIPEFVEKMLEAGQECFYGEDSEQLDERRINLETLKAKGKEVMSCRDASLIDVGNNVVCFQIESPSSSVTDELIAFMFKVIEEVEKNYVGMIISSKGDNFCLGANLPEILKNAQSENWDYLNKSVINFQNMNMAIKYCSKPIVSAPYGMVLGGGAEIVMHSTHVNAFAETYMGLVEVGVGLIPGGGGTKELLFKLTENVNDNKMVDLFPYVYKAFESIGMGTVSNSAAQSKNLGHLRDSDSITMNKEFLIYNAKMEIIQLSKSMKRKSKNKLYRVGGENMYATIKSALYNQKAGGFISEHDELVGSKVAYVLCGGKISSNSMVTEQYMLDLEREAFISLCGEVKTQERIMYMLTKGKPLRN